MPYPKEDNESIESESVEESEEDIIECDKCGSDQDVFSNGKVYSCLSCILKNWKPLA